MKRTAMKRTGFSRPRAGARSEATPLKRVGGRAAPERRSRLTRSRMTTRRPKADEPRVKGRPALTIAGWKALVEDLKARAGHCCEIPWCRRQVSGWRLRLDPHHVIPTSLGGPDAAWNVLIVCAGGNDTCHERFDVSYAVGKHLAFPVIPPSEKWEISLQYRVDKWSPLLPGSLREFYERPDEAF